MVAPGEILITTGMAALQFIEVEGVITGSALGAVLGADVRTHNIVFHHQGATMMAKVLFHPGETLQAEVATTTTPGFQEAEAQAPG